MNASMQRLLLAAGLVFGVAGTALADGDGGDNGMNRFTGDSWAALGGKDQELSAQKASSQKPSTSTRTQMPAKADRADHATISPPVRSHPTSLFRDDTGA